MIWALVFVAVLALGSWVKNSCQVWFFFALGPLEPSCARVWSVPYHATSRMPGPPATAHGKTLTLAGALLITFGTDQVFQSSSAPGAAHEYQTRYVVWSTHTA